MAGQVIKNSAALLKRRSTRLLDAWAGGQEEGNNPCDDLLGERILATAGGGFAAAPGGAVADLIAPNTTRIAHPVQVMVTNYRLKLVESAQEGGVLQVTLCGGHDLKSCDMNGLSDSYAAVSLIGDKHRSMQRPKRTRVSPKTVDPVWNETFVFYGVSKGAQLQVEIWDQARHSSEQSMGEVVVPNVVSTSSEAMHSKWMTMPVKEHGKQGNGFLSLCIRSGWHKGDGGSVPASASIPLMCIEKVKLDHCSRSIEVVTKVAEIFNLNFDSPEDALEILNVVTSRPAITTEIFCFSGAMKTRNRTFSWAAQLDRWMDRDGHSIRCRVDERLNAQYRLCPTYSQELIVPAGMNQQHANGSASFRTKSRFPIVTWAHPMNGALLARCSQPKVGSGFTSHHSADWMALMKFSASDRQQITICDARSFAAAEANRVKGGGTEYDATYTGCRTAFLDIENIHKMRESFLKLKIGIGQHDSFDKCSASISQWLHHVHGILEGANMAAEILESGESVIVHCSDGWDRTSQITSITSLLMDGYYRTIEGFIDLIEKDWLQTGHQFSTRTGLEGRSDQDKHRGEQAPVFIQFLDCVTQVCCTYPEYFEFTPRFLSFILHHSVSGRYVNFVGNCDKHRQELGIKDKGPCLWTIILQDTSSWHNPQYDKARQRERMAPCHIPLHRLHFNHELHASMLPTTSQTKAKRASFATSWHRSEETRIPSSCRHIFCNPCTTCISAEQESWSTACERLLRAFTSISASFPLGPSVRVTSHIDLGNFSYFVVEVEALNGESVMESHTVVRRYSEFRNLRRQLIIQAKLEVDVPFPPRILCGKCSGNTLEQRSLQLNTWICEVVSHAWRLRDPLYTNERRERSGDCCCFGLLQFMRNTPQESSMELQAYAPKESPATEGPVVRDDG